MRRFVLHVLPVALLLGVTQQPARSAAPTSPRCDRIAFSPTFRTDRTGFCLARSAQSLAAGWNIGPREVEIWSTTDGGRSWQPRGSLGDPYHRFNIDTGLWVSPMFADDRTLYVHMSGSGLYESKDLGATFELVDPLAFGGWGDWYGRAAAPFTVLVGGGEQPVTRKLLFGFDGSVPLGETSWLHTGHNVALIDPAERLHVPAAGAAESTSSLVSPAYGAGSSLIAVTGSSVAGVGLFGCTAVVACAVPLARLAPDVDLVHVTLHPDFDTNHVAYVITRGAPENHIPAPGSTSGGTGTMRLELSQSTDGGATFSPVASIRPMFEAVAEASQSASSVLSADRTLKGRLYLFVDYTPKDEKDATAPPVQQLFRSDDAGDTWRRVAFRRSDKQPGPRGTLPSAYLHDFAFTGPFAAYPHSEDMLVMTGDGRLFLAGYHRVHCSVDGGTRWNQTCSR